MNHTSTCAQKSQAAENFSGELQPEVKSTARSESGIKLAGAGPGFPTSRTIDGTVCLQVNSVSVRIRSRTL